ncbi:M23 family metallopeptidase [Galbibacter mesophilus]|uniref:M23 family metallopeptidase n=1 Tax=Galbibacter mesophilus TaxID=379069 RepID=UPI00191E71EC|nr:M23 family metallopeptidase [Galbibacter mesophilus]MCM5662606.1 M23 family metallopeptidase [Galbibacter mesophilus]
MKKRILLFIAGFCLISSCKQIQKATDFVLQPSAKEIYKREFKDSLSVYEKWGTIGREALHDSLFINTPFVAHGSFHKDKTQPLAFTLKLSFGTSIYIDTKLDNPKYRVFTEIYKVTNDSLSPFKQVATSENQQKELTYKVEETGTYKLLIQPEIATQSNFKITIQNIPLYTTFPVAGKSDTAIQSFWGARRDGGKRTHEGIDIFAKRGTPVVAVNDGFVRYTGEKGLGGKQVWLRDGQNNVSLYYAHLDSINASSGAKVSQGDTLGFVGNTGNARNTAPHLHFGIYKGFGGAVDPFPFVKNETLPPLIKTENSYSSHLLVNGSVANIRNSPTTKASKVITTAKRKDTLNLVSITEDWFQIKTANNQSGFIHKSLVKPL